MFVVEVESENGSLFSPTVKLRHERARKDELLILRGFAASAPATFHQAAVAACSIEGSMGRHFREESLRRRGSDLKRRGLIEQVDKVGKRGIFVLTKSGQDALTQALLALDSDGYDRVATDREKEAVHWLCLVFDLPPEALANIMAAALRRPLRDQRVAPLVSLANSVGNIGVAARTLAGEEDD